MGDKYNGVKIIAGNASQDLAKDIAKKLNLPLVKSECSSFSDGETHFTLGESVRGSDVFIVQSTSAPSNDNLMELLIMIDALKRSSAGRITVIIPYYGYARQDRKANPREPITAKLVANLLETAGADRVLTMDLHSSQIQGFFDMPLDHLQGGFRLANYFDAEKLDDVVIVSPDAGGIKRIRKLAKQLNCSFAIIDKHRNKPNESQVMNIIGDVEGKNCIMIDDIIDTAGTIVNGAEELMKRGAKSVRAGAIHGVLSGDAIKKLEESPLEEVVLLDTIHIPEEKRIDKLKILKSAGQFADAIKIIHNDGATGTFLSVEEPESLNRYSNELID